MVKGPAPGRPARRRRHLRWLAAFALAALAPLAPLGAAAPAELPAMDLSEVQRGQKGYGYSVFAGIEKQRFEVEILGVISNQSPNVSYVLARLSGQGLEDTGVIAGMSGSPVYVDGKLLGAVAFSWPFAEEAIAGITPIGEMRELAALPPHPGAAGGGEPAAASLRGGVRDLATLLPTADREPVAAENALAAELQKLRPLLAGQGVAAVGWSVAGFGAGTQHLLARGLGGVAPSGAAHGPLPERLQGGDAVAAVLVDGDLRLAATGTVTERRGDEVLAFGHPFLGLGPVEIPMAPAEVVTVLSSQYNSFKIANFGDIVGGFTQDRLAGIRGQIGPAPPMLPVTLRVEGARQSQFEVRLARVPTLTPVLLAVSALGAQEVAAQTSGPLGLDLEARFDLGERGPVEVEQSFDGPRASMDAAMYLLAFADFFVNNGFDEVDLRGVEVTVRQHPAPRTATLVGGYAERTELPPGSDVRLHLDLVPWRGEPVRHDLSLRLPADLPAGRYSLLVGDGVTLDALRMQVEPAAPQRLDQALRLVRRFHSRRELVALGVYAGSGLAVAGEVLPRLPGSLRSVWSTAASQSATPLRLTLAQEHVEPLPFPVEGAVRIDLQVVRKEPLTSVNGGEETAAEGAAPSAETEAPAAAPTAGPGVEGSTDTPEGR